MSDLNQFLVPVRILLIGGWGYRAFDRDSNTPDALTPGETYTWTINSENPKLDESAESIFTG